MGKEKVLIAGGSGLIGQNLMQLLLTEGYEVSILSRTENLNGSVKAYYWSPKKGEINLDALKEVDYIINLAGENIGGKKWSKSQKNKIQDSRMDSTKLLFNSVKNQKINLKAYISASAVGYYGAITSEKIYKESDPPHNDFLGQTCQIWEEAVDLFTTLDIRTAKLRTGVVLSKKGGALKKLVTPIKFFVGAPLGNGKQFMPWIHVDDLAKMYLFVMQHNQIKGPINAVAPQHVNNREFTKSIAKTIHRPILLPFVPKFMLKLVLGEMADMILYGSRVSAEKIIENGFTFKYESLNKALNQIFEQKSH
ncbi:MAG: TIGR01777 family oxidoreductase [Putridiphycobacter sp.]